MFALSRISLALALSALTGVPCHAQVRDREREATTQKFLVYLAEKPYHGWAFDRLIENAVTGRFPRRAAFMPQLLRLAFIGRELRSLSERVGADLGSSPSAEQRVLHARLLAAGGRHAQALAELARIADKSPDHSALIGDIQRRRGEFELAFADYGHGIALGATGELLESLTERRALCLLAQDRQKEAIAIFDELLAMRPEDLRLHASIARWAGSTSSCARAASTRLRAGMIWTPAASMPARGSPQAIGPRTL